MKNLILIFCVLLAAGCQSFSKYPISDAKADLYDMRLYGKWKFAEDTNKNNYYLVQKDHDPGTNKYHVMFFDRGGKNRTFEGSIYFSKVGDALFLNIPCWVRHADKYTDAIKDYEETGGYFFIRVIDANGDYSKLTTATVLDDGLARLKSSKEVYTHIARHMNEPTYYHDTAHFYKVQ